MSIDPDVVHALAPTGALRAAINLGNPVQAQGSPDEPRGVTVDIAAELARRLSVPCTLTCRTAAKDVLALLVEGQVDVAFLAVEPARAEHVRLTAPFTVIEAVYAARQDSPVQSAADVDSDGVRIGVKDGSAYDLFLTRTLQHAELVRGADGSEVFDAGPVSVVAGLRSPLTRFAQARGLRLIEPAFQQIRHAVALPKQTDDIAHRYVSELVQDLKRSGFVADALRRSGRDDALVAPD